MIAELPFVLLVAGIVLVGLYLANICYDHGTPQYISRKISHGAAGCGSLIGAFLFDNPWWLFVLALGFTILLIGARLVRPQTFRGTGGSTRAHALAECYFPLACTIAIAVGWGWLGNKWLAIVPILFLSYGDAITGVVRSQIYGKEVKGNWGSVAMFFVCLIVAWALFSPLWVGVMGTLAATLAERFTPLSRGFWDDNWVIPIASLIIMSVLTQI